MATEQLQLEEKKELPPRHGTERRECQRARKEARAYVSEPVSRSGRAKQNTAQRGGTRSLVNNRSADEKIISEDYSSHLKRLAIKFLPRESRVLAAVYHRLQAAAQSLRIALRTSGHQGVVYSSITNLNLSTNSDKDNDELRYHVSYWRPARTSLRAGCCEITVKTFRSQRDNKTRWNTPSPSRFTGL
ncbi:hypothetical protein KOW79_021517 [Hemibagrus wyckioides]|uniref:Uncharacterized protein n=1 Tax=Hemibagrus wyckioides TaxID=337641 RepID=A0A9D3N3R1_9TELE|nr:hypothetical protein KOW79_021517 [Hemibagrus wyckioides]